MTRKDAVKQLIIFIALCFGLTSLIMVLAHNIDSTGAGVEFQTLYQLACFMPAVSALLLTLVFKTRIRDLGIAPNFASGARVYVIAMVLGLLLSLIDYPVMSLLFPEAIWFENVDLIALVFQLMLNVAICAVLTFVSMGEEIGWLGYIYPRLERVGGMTFGIIAMGVVRGLWHIPLMLALGMKDVGGDVLTLIFSNIMLGSVLVLVTKLSESVVPGAFIHCMTNSLPVVYTGLVMIDEANYEKCYDSIELTTMIISAVFGVLAYVALLVWKKRRQSEVKAELVEA